MKTSKGKGWKDGSAKITPGKIEKARGGKIESPPDVLEMQKSMYAGKTQIKKEDGRRNVRITEDKRVDPYANVRSTKKHEESSNPGGNPLNITTHFDKKAYKKMLQEE